MSLADDLAAVPSGASFWLKNGRLPGVLVPDAELPRLSDGLCPADIRIEAGRIQAIEPPAARDGDQVNLRQGLIWPGFVDMHTHLDKGHIWPRQANPDGTFMGALNSVRSDCAANWSADDVHARADFSLRTAYAHGTTAIRTHIDSMPPQDAISWPVFEKLRDEWSGRIALQAVSLIGIEAVREPGLLNAIADRVKAADGVLGAVTYMVDDLRPLLIEIFEAASSRGLDLDFHVDESVDPGARSLEIIADLALETGFGGRIVCGHCCSLSVLSESDVMRVLAKLATAQIGIVSLPMCNMYLQDRHPGTTPRVRGVTLIQEMQAAGIDVAIASDNTRDPFYAYGDLDGLEVFREAVRIGHLDHPIEEAPSLITATPAKLMGLAQLGWIKAGGSADLILFNGRTYTELLSRPEAGRIVLRAGRPIDRILPDYRDLDARLGAV